MDTRSYWLETLGCPKNEVDSDKLITTLLADGYAAADSPEEADLVVVNTCAFIESARQESIDTILALGDQRRKGAELVVTGCMAERYGDELAEALPEVDRIAAFGASLTASTTRVELSVVGAKSFDLLELPRSPSKLPWAYV
ncbi:MAG: 30S ribosomal protein S12 methylthiotransferase RimO, partial [Actinomycetes bacterium]